MSRARICWLLLVLTAALACADGGPPPRNIRLSLRPETDVARPAPTVVFEQNVLEHTNVWFAQAPSTRVDRDRHMVLLIARDRRDVARLARRGRFDPTLFNEVHVSTTFTGSGRLVAEFWRQDELVGTSAEVRVPQSDEPVDVVLPLPRELLDERRCSMVSLRCLGQFRRLGVGRVAFVERHDVWRLPDVAAGEDWIEIEGDARRGVGLAPDSAAVVDVEVRQGSVLGFSYGRPDLLQRKRGRLELVVSVSDGDGRSEERRYLVRPGTMPWRTERWPLAGWEGQTVRVRFSAEGEPGAACAVADPGLWEQDGSAPRVLLVTSDTHRGDHLGCADGDVDVRTPHLDALAARGVRFTDCFSLTNTTNPSHVALMTGVHPRDTGVLANGVPISDAAATLSERFAEAGFATQAVVSANHLGQPASGLGQGFDRISWPTARTRRADVTVRIAERWRHEARGRPLFLWVHVFDAHTPYDPPGDFDRLYYDGHADPFDPALPELDLPDGVLAREMKGLRDLDFARAQYRGEVSYVDAMLGPLLEARWNVAAVTSDHGESLGAHGVYFAHHGIYPDTLHVPLVLAWRGGPQGVAVTQPVSHLDLGRTLLDLAGLKHAEFPGRGLTPLPRLEARPPEPRFQLAGHGRSASVQLGDLYLILHLEDHHGRRVAGGQEKHAAELFDRGVDPDCLDDLSDERPDATRAMVRQLVDWLVARRPRAWGSAAAEDPELLSNLRALGYVGVDPDAAEALWDADGCDHCRGYGLDET